MLVQIEKDHKRGYFIRILSGYRTGETVRHSTTENTVFWLNKNDAIEWAIAIGYEIKERFNQQDKE